MKIFLILLTVIIFTVSSSFAQSYTVKVSWDDDSQNCACQASINSYFLVTLTIHDAANDDYEVFDDEVQVALEADYYVFDTDEVETYCADTSVVNIPNFTIYAGVRLKCDQYNPPQIVCSDKLTDPDNSCLDFSTAQIVLPEIST